MAHQLFVSNLQIMRTLLAECPCLLDQIGPVLGQGSHILTGSKPNFFQRECHVATIADQMNESRFRQQPADLRHLSAVKRSLVSPARLAKAGRVDLIKGAKSSS